MALNPSHLDCLKILSEIKNFFRHHDFFEVITPPIVANPGMEPHIHPLRIYSEHEQKKIPLYLHTSPEFHLKELLSYGLKKIFSASYCFRDEPSSQNHRRQFIMLEWYRTEASYFDLMDDCEKLIVHLIESLKIEGMKKNIPVERKTVQQIFQEILSIDILNLLGREELEAYVARNHPSLYPPDVGLSWEDYFFILFLNCIEPQLVKYPGLILYDYPAPLSALSRISPVDARVAQRFELYLYGIEVANCFDELTDLVEQKQRWERARQDKLKLYQYELPEPKVLFKALERGLPPCSGIALGVERLSMALTGKENMFWD